MALQKGDTFAAAIRGQGWCLRGLLAALLPSVDLPAADLGLLLLLLSRHRMPRAYTLASSHLQQPQQQQQGVTRIACICLDRHRTRRKEPQQLLLLLQQHGRAQRDCCSGSAQSTRPCLFLLCVSILSPLSLCLLCCLGIRPFGSADEIPSGFHDGVCSSYLLGLRPGDKGPHGAPNGAPWGAPVAALCCCKPSSFKLPADAATPMILVAAGTGESPNGVSFCCCRCLLCASIAAAAATVAVAL